MKRNRGGRRGETFANLLVAVGLFTVGLSFILGLLPRIEHSVALARQQRRAVLVVENQMEILQTTDLKTLAEAGRRPLGDPSDALAALPLGEGFIEVSPDAAGYRTHIEIAWGEGAQRQAYRVETILSDRIER